MEVVAKKIDENQYIVTERYWLISKNEYGALVTKNELDKIIEKCAHRKVDCIVFNDEVCESCYISKRNNFLIIILPMVLGYIFTIINYLIIQPLIFLAFQFVFKETIAARLLGFCLHVIVILYLPYFFAFFDDVISKFNSLKLPRDVYIRNSNVMLKIDSKIKNNKRLFVTKRDVRRSKELAAPIILLGAIGFARKRFIVYIVVFILTFLIVRWGINKFLYHSMVKRQVGTEVNLTNIMTIDGGEYD